MSETFDTAKLAEEIGRYLAAVDLFRAEGREPRWRPELDRGAVASSAAPAPNSPLDNRLH